MLTYTVTVRRTVEEDLDIAVTAENVELAVEQALAQARQGFNTREAVVICDVIGNIHGSDGSLWI